LIEAGWRDQTICFWKTEDKFFTVGFAREQFAVEALDEFRFFGARFWRVNPRGLTATLARRADQCVIASETKRSRNAAARKR
jgi:hypothetical protein